MLSFGLNPWLLVLSAFIAAGLAFWLYRTTTPEIARSRRILLGLLRFAALFLILFLLLEPVLRTIDREERRPVVAVLLDDSESLRITAAVDSSSSSLHAVIEDVLGRLPETLSESDIRFFRFGADLEAESDVRTLPDSLRFSADRTNISQALEDVRERLREENYRAAVLVSDGQYNTGRNPIYTAERYPVPIFTAVLGDTTRHVDVQIRRVTTNEIAYVGTVLPVQVGVRSEGLDGQDVTVSLLRNDIVESSERITLPEGESEVTVDLAVEPETEGLQRYTVAVTELPGEVTHRNNQETVTVRVLESRRRALLVAGRPGPDVASTRQLLLDDPTFEVSSFVQKDATSFYEGSFPGGVDDVDLLILLGYPGREADAGVVTQVADMIEEGIPVFYLLTTGSDIALLNDYLADVLPARADQVRGGFMEAAFVPTSAGLAHPILNIEDASPENWRRFPPLAFSQTRWVASPDADILATTSVRGIDLDDPMLVVRRRSQHRSAALLGAGTWRWRNVPEDLSQLDHLWPSLFSNTAQWLTARADDRPVRVVPSRDVFAGDEPVQISGQVYDESLNPVDDASVEVNVTAPDGTVNPYVLNPIGNGRYTLDAGTFPEGTYRFEAEAIREGDTLGADAGGFAVGSLTLEFKETRANAPIMQQIARRSGGDVLDLSNPDAMSSVLSSTANLASLIVEREAEMDLRRHHIFLALIVLLLTAEWFIRKRSGMV
ncbi:MAG: hypothetical protein WD021_05565 [Rhodothermales bacterium]